MKIFFSEEQKAHSVEQEFVMGSIRPAMDDPSRARVILEAIEANGLGVAERPGTPVPKEVLRAVHDRGLLSFLETLHTEWSATYPGGGTFPEMGIAPGMRRMLTDSLRGRLVYYCFDTCTSVGAHTWPAAMASLETAASGAMAIAAGDEVAFSLCRPPGHHAGSDFYGGYCYLNNAAVAAQAWLKTTGTRCAILDLDFHHGNGTQEIFYERHDVFYVSIHRLPTITYPFFSGYEDERGTGAGFGYNLNLPLPKDTTWANYEPALGQALDGIRRFLPSALIISLGVDTYAGDPVGGLGLHPSDLYKMGSQVGSERIPTLVVMEGGYAKEMVGECVASFLNGIVAGQDNTAINVGKEPRSGT